MEIRGSMQCDDWTTKRRGGNFRGTVQSLIK